MVKLSRIAPELPVADLPKAIRQYQSDFGFHLTLQMPAGDYAIVERDEIALHLFQDDSRRHTPVAVHIFTSELEALCAEFQHRGIPLTQGIERKPWGNRDFRLKDEFGNELKFSELQAED